MGIIEEKLGTLRGSTGEKELRVGVTNKMLFTSSPESSHKVGDWHSIHLYGMAGVSR